MKNNKERLDITNNHARVNMTNMSIPLAGEAVLKGRGPEKHSISLPHEVRWAEDQRVIRQRVSKNG